MGKKYYIKKNMEQLFFLEIDEKINPLQEIKQNFIFDKNDKKSHISPKINYLTSASYSFYDIGFIGTLISDRGRVLFVNNQKYLFSDPLLEIYTTQGDPTYHFRLVYDGKVICNFDYSPVLPDPVYWDSDDEDDLLLRLSRIKNDPDRLQEYERWDHLVHNEHSKENYPIFDPSA